jgi:hypothetical protein
MKIRHNFVSNSSSTSFIIGYNPSKYVKCPTCGHRPLDIIELVETDKDNDTKIFASSEYGDINESINNLKQNIKTSKQQRTIPYRLRKSKYYSNERLDEEINILEQSLEQIVSFTKKWERVILVDISNHTTTILDEMNDQKSLGFLDYQEMNDNDF